MYYRLPPYPIPAFPPYVVKTQHLHGARTTAATIVERNQNEATRKATKEYRKNTSMNMEDV